MLHDIVHHQEQLPIELHHNLKEEVFKFYESELFLETHQNISEVASSSNVGDEEYSSKPTNVSSVLYNSDYNNNINNNINNINNYNNTNDNDESDNLSLVFDSPGEIENNTVCDFIDFNHSTNNTFPQFVNNQQVQQYDTSSLNNQTFHEANDIITNNSLNHHFNNNLEPPPVIPHVTTSSLFLPNSIKDEPFSTFAPSYTQTNPTTCSLLNSSLETYMSTPLPICDNSMNLTMPGLYLSSDLTTQNFNFLVDNNLGYNFPDTISPIFDCNDTLQGLTNDNQHLIKEHLNSTSLTSGIASNLEDESDFKVGKLSVEERKEKINRYIKKRHQRNFGKKIKYACRKTLADSRPRVRGRFAKYDDLLEGASDAIMNHEEEVRVYDHIFYLDNTPINKILKFYPCDVRVEKSGKCILMYSPNQNV